MALVCDELLDEHGVALEDEAGVAITSGAPCTDPTQLCDELLDEAGVPITDEAYYPITSEAACVSLLVPPDDIHPHRQPRPRGGRAHTVHIIGEGVLRVRITGSAVVKRINRGDDELMLLY